MKVAEVATTYHQDTPAAVVKILERYRKNWRVVRLHYGNTDPNHPDCGLDRLEEFEVVGTIGRSTGIVKVPLLVEKGENGGGTISSHRLVKIVEVATGKVLYKHPKYRLPVLELKHTDEEYPWKVMKDGEVHAGFIEQAEACRFILSFC